MFKRWIKLVILCFSLVFMHGTALATVAVHSSFPVSVRVYTNTPAVNFQASYVENLHDTAKMLIFAALLCRPPAPPWACTHKKLLGWWNGRHEGLKILWPLRLCGFKSRSEYKTNR